MSVPSDNLSWSFSFSCYWEVSCNDVVNNNNNKINMKISQREVYFCLKDLYIEIMRLAEKFRWNNRKVLYQLSYEGSPIEKLKEILYIWWVDGLELWNLFWKLVKWDMFLLKIYISRKIVGNNRQSRIKKKKRTMKIWKRLI